MSKEKKKEYVLKIAILGDAGVGKTSLVNQYVSHTFKSDYRGTLGVAIIKKDVELTDINAYVRLLLWDIAGQDHYEKTRKKYYEGCTGALLVYDMTRFRSFENIENKWYDDFKNHIKSDVPYILIGNKSDLDDERVVNKDNALELASKLNAIEFLETSAKNGSNVEEAFLKLVRKIIQKR